MKKSLTIITLVSLAVPAIGAAAEMAGAVTSAAFSLEVGLSVFVSAFFLLLFGGEYEPVRPYTIKHYAPVLLPAPAAFQGSRSPFARSHRRPRAFRPTVTL